MMVSRAHVQRTPRGVARHRQLANSPTRDKLRHGWQNRRTRQGYHGVAAVHTAARGTTKPRGCLRRKRRGGVLPGPFRREGGHQGGVASPPIPKNHGRETSISSSRLAAVMQRTELLHRATPASGSQRAAAPLPKKYISVTVRTNFVRKQLHSTSPPRWGSSLSPRGPKK